MVKKDCATNDCPRIEKFAELATRHDGIEETLKEMKDEILRVREAKHDLSGVVNNVVGEMRLIQREAEHMNQNIEKMCQSIDKLKLEIEANTTFKLKLQGMYMGLAVVSGAIGSFVMKKIL